MVVLFLCQLAIIILPSILHDVSNLWILHLRLSKSASGYPEADFGGKFAFLQNSIFYPHYEPINLFSRIAKDISLLNPYLYGNYININLFSLKTKLPLSF